MFAFLKYEEGTGEREEEEEEEEWEDENNGIIGHVVLYARLVILRVEGLKQNINKTLIQWT